MDSCGTPDVDCNPNADTMSTWIEIKDKFDLSYNNRKETIDVLYGSDDSGNNYVSIPIDMLISLLEEAEILDPDA